MKKKKLKRNISLKNEMKYTKDAARKIYWVNPSKPEFVFLIVPDESKARVRELKLITKYHRFEELTHNNVNWGTLMKSYEFKRLATNIVQNLLNEGYGIKDFELCVEKYNNKLYFASYRHLKPGLDDFDSANSKRFVTATYRELGFKEEFDRDEADIVDNGKLIDHQSLYKAFTKSMKKSALKEVDGYPKTALLIEWSDKNPNFSRWILAPSLELGKKYFASYSQTKHFKRIRVLDWAQDVTKDGGYEEFYDISWKKEIALVHNKSNVRVLGKE